ncbi:MAG: hypothetical protein C4538_03055 [Nitrospiraceae bacterium]|nr:MAG: hypothetical protein C4538_03055 [Nitrospiraceae bacterium]
MRFKETKTNENKAAKKHLSFSDKKTFADVFLSDEGRGPFRTGKRNLSCAIAILDEHKEVKAIFTCTGRSLYELVKLVGLFRKDKVLEKYGEWEILKGSKDGSPYIQQNDIRHAITEEEFRNFVDMVNTLNEHPDIHKELLEVRGAL